MENEMRVKILENTYVHVLIDSILNYQKHGILNDVIKEKEEIQMMTGKMQVQNFGITKVEEVFTKLSETFNCAKWEINETEDGLEMISKSCKLCDCAKKMNAESPCHVYCLNPMKGMVRGLDDQLEFEVKETLYGGDKCRILIR